MKTSICITTLNEEKTVGKMLDALLGQSIRPFEIIIVDGGSCDKTVNIIRHYQKKYSKIKVLIEKGNISVGRNVSIEIAKGEIIVLTDAGCIAHSDWLEKITHPFDSKRIDVVAGFYNMVTNSSFQKAVAPFHGVPPQRFDSKSFLPSARSMAFKKNVWEEIGGFSEKLDGAGEDTLFCYQLILRGYKMVRVKEAVVDWEVPKTFSESTNKFFAYAKGDAQAGIWWNPAQKIASHNIKISAVFGRYFLGICFVVLSFWIDWLPFWIGFGFLVYLYWSVWKWRDVVKGFKERVWLPVIQLSADFTVMGGFLSGMFKK
jgi:glycosyltransferase involved in cell wall biosynthesis